MIKNNSIIEPLKDNAEKDKIYLIKEILSYIKNIITDDKLLQNLWIKGEISDYKAHNNGHIYFKLKEEKSILDGVIFNYKNKDLGINLEDGMKVVIKGKINTWNSSYQIIVEQIHSEGKGEIYFKFLRLKEKLQKEGLFAEERKREISRFPKVIGIVTSPEGAVIHDIIRVIKNKYPHVKLLVYPSLVQGDRAKETIVKGLEVLNNLSVDTIIIARGGGSFEDLMPFNEEIVARSIFNSKIPVISSIGHEGDVPISDLVADKRAPTPSMAADMAVPNKRDIVLILNNSEKGLRKWIVNSVNYKKQLLDELIGKKEFRQPYSILEFYQKELQSVKHRLNDLSPYSILNRGYSIVLQEDRIITSTKDINKGDTLSIIVKDGTINTEVKNKDGKRKDI